MSAYRLTRDLEHLEVAAANSLYDRRAFLAGGAALAAAITGYALSDTAAAQQLTDAPWSTRPGIPIDWTETRAYGFWVEGTHEQP